MLMALCVDYGCIVQYIVIDERYSQSNWSRSKQDQQTPPAKGKAAPAARETNQSRKRQQMFRPKEYITC